MSLYGRTDSNANKTKAGVGIAASSQAKTTVFVDKTEAQLAETRSRGITAPGWWSYFTYTDADGNTRHKAEQLVNIANPDLNSNETQSDDTIAADVASAVTITAQPANSTSSSGAGTYTLTTSTTGILAQSEDWSSTFLQYQRKPISQEIQHTTAQSLLFPVCVSSC